MLTMQTRAPYNRFDMSVDDPALAAAIRRHEERLARDPASLAFAQLADLYRKAGRTRQAVAVCRNGLLRYPHYTTARLILVKALAAEGQLEPALAEIGAILEVNPNDLQGHRLAAEIHRRLGHIDRAVTHLEAAVRLDPGDRESRSLLGLLHATTPSAGEASGLQRVLADETFATIAFGTGEKVALVDFAETHMQFLYKDDRYHFMDVETYEQVSLSSHEVGDARDWLRENTEVDVLYIEGRPVAVELPNFVELAIAKTDPGVRGDTAQGGTKPATLETGAVILVPLFLNDGDIVKVDTRTGGGLRPAAAASA